MYILLLALIIFSALAFFSTKNTACGMIRELGVIPYYYPRHYIKTDRLLVKCFKVPDKEILKYLYAELYMALIFALLGPVALVVFLISGKSLRVVGIFLVIFAVLVVVTMLCNMFLSVMYKQKKLRTQKKKGKKK